VLFVTQKCFELVWERDVPTAAVEGWAILLLLRRR